MGEDKPEFSEGEDHQRLYLRFNRRGKGPKFEVVFPYYVLRCQDRARGLVGDLFVSVGKYKPGQLVVLGRRPLMFKDRKGSNYISRNLGSLELPPGKDLEHLSKGDTILVCPKDKPCVEYSFLKYSN